MKLARWMLPQVPVEVWFQLQLQLDSYGIFSMPRIFHRHSLKSPTDRLHAIMHPIFDNDTLDRHRICQDPSPGWVWPRIRIH